MSPKCNPNLYFSGHSTASDSVNSTLRSQIIQNIRGRVKVSPGTVKG